ncbi:MAG: hypothetical protein V1790_01480 [Planctomycetota bacterium]
MPPTLRRRPARPFAGPSRVRRGRGEGRQGASGLVRFLLRRRRHDLTIADVARQVDTPRASTIRDLLKGTYREHADEATSGAGRGGGDGMN